MKIYAIIHKFDNGLKYGEYREDIITTLYSDLDKALETYQTKEANAYIGSFKLVKWELDTNKKKTLKESKYIPTKPWNPFEEEDKQMAYGDDGWEYIE